MRPDPSNLIRVMPAKGDDVVMETVPVGDEPREVAATLESPPPRLLGFLDQTALWGNLGISLLLIVAGTFLLAPDPSLPPLSLAGAVTAVVVGAVLGNLLLGLGARAGAETGAPAMVLLRGLLGRRGSFAPTGANIAQNLGWATVEIMVIAAAVGRLLSPSWRPVAVVATGAAATIMALRPLGVVRGYLKRVAVWVVLASTAYLFVQVLRRPMPGVAGESWTAFWKATDIVIALPISWLPLAADYTRHSRSPRAAFGGAAVGYGLATIGFFLLGVLATASGLAGDDVIASLLALPAGTIALVILVIDEVDEVFANVYSTVVSAQNLRPRLDRRWAALAVGGLATTLALVFDDYVAYESFLLLLGSVFVPLFAAFVVDYYLVRRGSWDVSDDARTRWPMVIPWIAGFVTYQLVNPGLVAAWRDFWVARQADLGFTPPSWASASILSFVVAGALAYGIGRATRERP